MRVFLIAFFYTVAVTGYAASLSSGEPVNICGDGAGWPPYHYEKDGEFKGYDLDVLNSVFEGQGLNFEFTMPPWARCLAGLDNGRYHLGVSSSYSKERDKKYLMTEFYYVLTPYYFYSKERFPDGIAANTIEDLKKHRICGLRGYNYAGFGFGDGDVDRGTGSFDQLVAKLAAKRCDVFIARFQILKGFDVVGKPVLNEDVAYAPIPGVEGDKFYMLISRKYPNAKALKELLDKGFKELREKGELETLLKKYL